MLSICMASTSSAATIHVFAAASLGNALEAIATQFQAQSPTTQIRIASAGSSVLARQIAAGAPADLFISANAHWMQYVLDQDRVINGTTKILAENDLVLISHHPGAEIMLDQETDFRQRLGSQRLAVALTDAVPAGMYAKQALEHLGHWEQIRGALAQADNVRAALKLVALGETPYGIVYATDAIAEPHVHYRGTFPSTSHAPIQYPTALLKTQHAENVQRTAREFYEFLFSESARQVLKTQGFRVTEP